METVLSGQPEIKQSSLWVTAKYRVNYITFRLEYFLPMAYQNLSLQNFCSETRNPHVHSVSDD